MLLHFIHWDIQPEIFRIGEIAIRYYSLLFAVGLLLSYYLLKRIYADKSNVVDALFIYIFIGTVAGARLGHCLFYEWAYYKYHILEMLLPIQQSPITGEYFFTGYQGLASHGGTIGVIISVGIFSYFHRQNFLALSDKLAIVTPIAGGFIRLGNLMNSEIIGKQTQVIWAFIFTRVDDLPRHPAQLYEAISYFSIFAILYILYKTNSFSKGFYLGLFFILTFTARFFIEFIKENQEQFENSMTFNMGQYLSIPFILLGIILVIYSLKGQNTKEL